VPLGFFRGFGMSESAPQGPSPAAVPPIQAEAPRPPPATATSVKPNPIVLAAPRRWWARIKASDRIALIALFLSLATVGWQIVGHIQGPMISFIPPITVTLQYHPYGEGAAIALTASSMNYLNDGRKDYDGLVLDEKATITGLGDHPITLEWWWFMAPQGSANDQAHPVVVPGGGLTSHETRFTPVVRPCPSANKCTDEVAYSNFFPWERWLISVADKSVLPHLDIDFSMTIRERRDRVLTYQCRVLFDERVRGKMREQLAIFGREVAKGTTLADIEDVKDFKEFLTLPCVRREMSGTIKLFPQS
jgi:hypothetical protein